MKLNKLFASAVFVAFFGAAAPLSAAIVQVEYTGTVSDGYDFTGVFGTANTFLTGAAYTANYTFDTTIGLTETDWYYNRVSGGTYYGNLSPSLGATITINGNTVSVLGTAFGYLTGVNVGNFSQVYHDVNDLVDTGTGYIQTILNNGITNNNGALPISLTDPLSYAVIAGDTGFGHFEISNFGVSTFVYAELAPNHVTINAPIPEPETYAMLLAGLGLLGWQARRRKLKLAA